MPPPLPPTQSGFAITPAGSDVQVASEHADGSCGSGHVKSLFLRAQLLTEVSNASSVGRAPLMLLS